MWRMCTDLPSLNPPVPRNKLRSDDRESFCALLRCFAKNREYIPVTSEESHKNSRTMVYNSNKHRYSTSHYTYRYWDV